ncbi:hypothetical protein BDB13_6246 [Rhodococcus sp. OK302]|nr:hypothetical protein BDB13_6246 [Rhodococcus sp. OK302]
MNEIQSGVANTKDPSAAPETSVAGEIPVPIACRF